MLPWAGLPFDFAQGTPSDSRVVKARPYVRFQSKSGRPSRP
jgi:hypothetical protein